MVHWDEHATHLANRLGYLLEHQLFVDVTLMCNTHTLKVHRSVLAACSPYFEEVLQRQLGNHPLIVLKDMKFSVLKSMIEFMYCGETSVTEENLNPLMEAAKFFEVKGLSSMSKDGLTDKSPATTQNSISTTAVTSTTSTTDFTNISSYKGRGRRPGVSRGGRRSATVPTQVLSPGSNTAAIISTSPVPQTESAQILLSLSGNNSSQTLQTSNRNVRITPNNCMNKIIRNNSNFIEGQNGTALQNGTLVSSELKPLRRPSFEPRRRGRRKQNNLGFGRGRDKDLDCKLAVENLKKEMEDIQQKDSVLFKHFDSSVNFLNNNVLNSSDKSPLLASLLSKAEQLNGKEKLKDEGEELVQKETSNSEQEMVLCQFDGETNNVGKYLDVLKEAGLPTDVPVLIDSGDGNYVTLTEDFLMNVLGSNKDLQFQVTEATLQQGEVGEGVVLQDGSIMMTARDGKSDVGGTILSVDNDFRVVKDNKREIKTKCSVPNKQFIVKEMQASKSDEEDCATQQNKPTSKEVKQKSKLSVQDFINEAVLESLKSGAATDTEVDPDAVILFEVTDNAKVAKYVVSSKEVNALKALNEQIVQKKKLMNGNKEEIKCNNISTVGIAGSKTKIAEVKLTVGKNYKKSIISQVLECAQNLEGKNAKLDFPEEEEKLQSNTTETEHHSQIVSLEFIDGNGEKIEGYQLDGPKLSNKQITELTEQTNSEDHSTRDQDVMGLLDMVCEEAAQSVMESQVLDNVTPVNPENEILNGCAETENSVNQNVDSNAGAEYLNVEIKDVHSCLNTEHLVLDEVQNNSVNSSHCQEETPEISLDGQELAVEQALEAMMGDSESRSNTITQDFKEVVRSEQQSHENNNLQLVLDQENELSEKQILEESNDFQFVYSEDKLDERSGSEVIIMEPVDDVLLSTLNNTDKNSLVMGDVIAEECIETSVISPTKDVPFAVGLLPLKTALEKIQLKTEHQPRKTRSGIVTLRHESQAGKRRPSTDSQSEMPEKKIKTEDGREDVTEHIVAVEEECVVTTT